MQHSKSKHFLLFAAVCLILTLAAPLAVSVFADGEAEVVTAVEEGSVEADIAEAEAAAAAAEEEAAAEEDSGGSMMYATFFSLIPPIVAIVLALITKEVYFSLFIGILCGALFAADFNPVGAVHTMFENGFVAKLADSWNVGILIFLVILGIMVVLMNKAGGSAAYGRWAEKKIKGKKGAQFATFALGCMIFVDDYFNCLTVGSVMRPIADTHNTSRAKLAYIIDATAAPICMIAPISSWAAAVTGVVEGYNGLELFIRAIPYNLYSLLTLVMIFVIISLGLDFGPMAKHERNAEKGDIYTTDARPFANVEEEKPDDESKGRVIDLVLPVIALIVCCVIGMIYTGGFFEGANFIDAFANCDAAFGLAIGSFLGLVITFFIYIPRKVITFRQFAQAIPAGFKAMVPAILILTFAWTLSAMTGLLGADVYVASLIDNSAEGLKNMLPAIIFVVALFLAFATGTSWGTFSILLPIVVKVLPVDSELLIIAVSACLAGAVCGDHCSPISDTTIMASTGARCDHINHVNTQLPYALFVAAISFIGYIVAGFVQMWFVVLPIMIAVLVGLILILRQLAATKSKR